MRRAEVLPTLSQPSNADNLTRQVAWFGLFVALQSSKSRRSTAQRQFSRNRELSTRCDTAKLFEGLGKKQVG
jgi:hypothetical protein